MMEIRIAKGEDTQALLDLYRAFIVAMQAFDAEDAVEDAQLFEWIAGGISGDDSQIWVADAGNQLAGFARVCEKRRDDTVKRQRYAKLNDLFIMPAKRRGGLAAGLMRQAHAWAADRRLASIVLNVYQVNVPARMLYEHIGYRKLFDRTRGRLMMIKNLAVQA